MAFVNLPINKRKLNPPKSKSKSKNLIHKLVYNTLQWRELRIQILMNNPFCQVCNNEFAIEVHHIIPISQGKNKFQMVSLGLNEKNLLAVCPKCHKEVHEQIKLNKYF